MSHQQERLHRIPEACGRLGIGRSYLYELMGAGRIRSVKVGRRRLVPESAIREFIEQLDAEVA
ncbi:helix-turn-helix transcriptional regulator [Nocardia cyriacigeorgica]|uniref:Putative excision nuclease n=1 Tax=Nocardia cyriacigeorgica (strain GUH-2) TaxID=1127134 RepID=H6R9X7_NOCCG|nr:excisionase family DNA-binding protein [Nocardia cyriacigeorgica]AVH21179.1 helix-turn-helix domain-containing protein [Nocardia cyriacigeorgica]PPJ07604.1 helix-turn-helix domain-containing protein [Nocardia cyriacigeorgica]BDT84597.1 excisionase [Nocardia cyriacigeorgica]CCF61185.1 putative excision nuclease [Nocardia cyriacigeorgica GUH-2]